MSDIHKMAEDAVRPHARELAADHAQRSELNPLPGSVPSAEELKAMGCEEVNADNYQRTLRSMARKSSDR